MFNSTSLQLHLCWFWRYHIRALKIASFSFYIDDDNDDPLGGICELENVAGENVPESLSIINVDIRGTNDGRGAEWGMLNTVFTSSGWPALKAVVLKICLLPHQLGGLKHLSSLRRYNFLDY